MELGVLAFQPMPLARKPLPFDHPEWIFELKYDGFRSLAVIQNDRTQLISRNRHPFSFDLGVLCMRLRPCSMGRSSALMNEADHSSVICYSITGSAVIRTGQRGCAGRNLARSRCMSASHRSHFLDNFYVHR
jgi:hypothetical protein